MSLVGYSPCGCRESDRTEWLCIAWHHLCLYKCMSVSLFLYIFPLLFFFLRLLRTLLIQPGLSPGPSPETVTFSMGMEPTGWPSLQLYVHSCWLWVELLMGPSKWPEYQGWERDGSPNLFYRKLNKWRLEENTSPSRKLTLFPFTNLLTSSESLSESNRMLVIE